MKSLKIIYVAKHGPADNRDEEAIGYALEKLGHEVIRIEERRALSLISNPITDADFLLYHKWERGLSIISQWKHCPIAFWDFDLVYSADPTLSQRIATRTKWMAAVLPHITVGFCTDGDWVNQDKSGKLVHLMQGADERLVGYGDSNQTIAPIIFTGSVFHGADRANHIASLQARYGDQFQVIGNGPARDKKHGRALADLFASTKIVVAPDGPNTNNYWSNRVYLTLGLGGFLLHPYCEKLLQHYDSNELVMYHSKDELEHLIDYYLTHDAEREIIRRAGHERTLQSNLYRHRCEKLIEIMKERI